MPSTPDNNIGLVVAADIEREKLPLLIQSTCLISGVEGYKIGKKLTFLPRAAETVAAIRELTDLDIIFDGQKEGTDIPQTGIQFAADCKTAGFDTVILFPLAGTKTQESYTKALQDTGSIRVIVGLHMTHPNFLVSEGGYIDDSAPARAFTLAAKMGVTDFVLPGNKLEAAGRYITLIDGLLGKGNWKAYAPGFLTQGGQPSEFAQLVGNRPAAAIVGSAIYEALDMTVAAQQIVNQLKQK